MMLTRFELCLTHCLTREFFHLMSPPSSVFKSKNTIAVMLAVNGLCLQMWSAVSAQVVTAQLADSAPLGLRAVLPTDVRSLFGPAAGLKGGFAYGVGAQAVYDSNFFLAEHHPKSELSLNVLPWASYYSDPDGGAPVSLTASYQPNLRGYQHHPDLNGFDNSGGVTLRVAGAKTLISAAVNYNTVSGADSLSGTFVTGSILAADIRGSYQIAPRTSLFAAWKLGMSDYGSSGLVGSDNYTTEVGGFWSATERLSVGPSFSYIRATSANTGTRDAWALSMQARYLRDEKLQFIASLGVQSATNSRDSGGNSLGLTGNLVADYAINDRLRWVNTVQYVTVPSPTDVNYVINNLTVSTALTRQLLRSSVSLGLDLTVSDYVDVGPVGTQLGKQDNLSAILSYSRKLFLDRVGFDASIRYTLNDGRYDWSQLQVTTGIKLEF